MLAWQTGGAVSDEIIHGIRDGHRVTTLRMSRHWRRVVRYQMMAARPLRVAIRV